MIMLMSRSGVISAGEICSIESGVQRLHSVAIAINLLAADIAICHSMMCEVIYLHGWERVCTYMHVHALSVNLPVYLHALVLTFIPASVFEHIVSLLPSYVSVSELITEKVQPSFARASSTWQAGRAARYCLRRYCSNLSRELDGLFI